MPRYAAICVTLLFIGCNNQSQPSGSAPVNAAAPLSTASATAAKPVAVAAQAEVKLDLKSYDELQQLIASKRGKLVVVDVWSTYCEPCMHEFPGLVALHKKYGPEKIACISLCNNFVGLGKPEDEIDAPLEFLKSQGATFDNILSTTADRELGKKLDVQQIPTILVYGRDGTLLKAFKNEAAAKYSEVEAFLQPHLN